MARQINQRDIGPTIGGAELWISKSLIGDASVFLDENLWTGELVDEVRHAFLDHLDDGEGDFIQKLRGQTLHASAKGRVLMAEMLWALLLFPSNVSHQTKRNHIGEIWKLSTEPFPENHQLLQENVLVGIGSGGPGFNNHRWREVKFILGLVLDLKQRAELERRQIFDDYDRFMGWMDEIPQEGHRQFRHMLRYFAFPDRVERMSSNKDRRRVLQGFGAAEGNLTGWSDKQLDTAMYQLRTRLEAEHPNSILDFYEAPLREHWHETAPIPAAPPVQVHEPPIVHPAVEQLEVRKPLNRIYYGPPGTGKTYTLQEKQREYTVIAENADHATWLDSVLSTVGWRPTIVVALLEAGAVKVGTLQDHPLIRAKVSQSGIQERSVLPTLWSFLQVHTPESVTTVNVATRRPPFVFSKDGDGNWTVLPDWSENDAAAVSLKARLDRGPTNGTETIRRFRTVTFHPSYSYEDFIRGIRPVTGSDGTATFQMVDGVFKQICDEARRDPSHRYALFIDEINRANIAKVFGEIISLLEVDKRGAFDSLGRQTKGLSVQLLGSDSSEGVAEAFAVPTNLDIFGTMNTADRSTALLDIALRRRFDFEEMEPDYAILDRNVEGIHLGRLLERMNDRLEFLLDRDHRIGHAYLINVRTLADIRSAFRTQLIPLLHEYFFDDLTRVAQVLATVRTAPFVEHRKLTSALLFPGLRSANSAKDRSRYVITPETTWSAESFRGVYADGTLNDEELIAAAD